MTPLYPDATNATMEQRVARPRGRQVGQFIKCSREEQIHFVGLLMLGTLTAPQAARAAGVSKSTLWSWRKRLLEDGCEDTYPLRAIESSREQILKYRREKRSAGRERLN